MMLGPFRSTTIPVLQEVVRFAQARHEVLAGNLANLHTPGYRVRDLSVSNFQQRLQEALAEQREASRGLQAEPWSPGLLSTDPGDPLREVGDSLQTVLHHDQTNVGMEQQVAELAKNQYLHNLAITVMASQFRLLQAAVSERV